MLSTLGTVRSCGPARIPHVPLGAQFAAWSRGAEHKSSCCPQLKWQSRRSESFKNSVAGVIDIGLLLMSNFSPLGAGVCFLPRRSRCPRSSGGARGVKTSPKKKKTPCGANCEASLGVKSFSLTKADISSGCEGSSWQGETQPQSWDGSAGSEPLSAPRELSPQHSEEKSPRSGDERDVRDGRGTGGAALWGNLVFKTHKCTLWGFFLPAAEAEG